MKLLSLTLLSTTIFGATLSPSIENNSLIVYNSNIGLVHEKRELTLKKNETQIIYEDVASSINTDSVNVELPENVSLFSQQYRFDKLTQRKLLDAHIGKRVDVKVVKNDLNYKIIKATLLSNDGTKSLVKNEKNNILSVQSNDIIFKNIPDELITKPSLVWNIETSKSIKSKMSIDYLISNIRWSSNYILNLKKDKANLSGWITIDNRSGKSFKATELYVLAGDINRATQPIVNYRSTTKMEVLLDSAPKVAHQAHEGYHFYSVPFKVTIANNEKTQIKFITKDDIDIKREYTSTMQNPNYINGEIEHDVTQHITMKGLDLALPQGVIRTYSKLKNTNILLGESQLKHTPKDTPISLKLGKNFDIKVTETLLERDDSRWQLVADVNYTIKNSSDELKTVKILVPFNKNNGSEVKTKQKYEYTKGNLVTFSVDVKPKSSKEFKVHFKTKK